ncbi:MAG: ABC transporter ATP-binding protein [Solirubrobacteraceae bacterium]
MSTADDLGLGLGGRRGGNGDAEDRGREGRDGTLSEEPTAGGVVPDGMTPNDPAPLEARGVACAIGKRTIVRDVDLTVRTGEMLAVVGPNGTGKSTLLRALAGVRPVAAGTVLLNGTPIQDRSARRRAREVAMVGQEEAPPADLLVGELVALGRTPHRSPWAGGDAAERDAVLSALAAVDLADVVDRPVEHLSGGERRRVLLARGLAQEAPLLLLDEPTNHLDIRHQLALLAMVRRLERTVVLAMHDLDMAAAFCDRIAVLHDGYLHTVGPPADVLTPDTVRTVFGVRATPVVHPETGETHLLFDPDPSATDRTDGPPEDGDPTRPSAVPGTAGQPERPSPSRRGAHDRGRR